VKIQKHQAIKGKVQVSVVQSGEIARQYEIEDNLILDQGLDMPAIIQWNQVFLACAVGNGTTPTSEDLGATATAIGTALQTNLPVLTGALLNADVVFPGGERFKIQAVTDTTHAVLFQNGEITLSTPFHIEFTNQVGLASELKRTTNYLTTPGACGTTVTPGIITLQRTFLFPNEIADTTYTEIGLSPTNTVGANLFSRILLATPVLVLGPSPEIPGGQQLQVTYQLLVEFDYGQGPGNFFEGRTQSEIPVSGLPIIYPIFAYENSDTVPGNLAVSVAGRVTALVGGSVIINGSSVPGYNGVWNVIDRTIFTDGIHGLSTLLTIQVPWSTTATGGTLNTDLSGAFFRACQGIYYVGSSGQSTAPTPTHDVFEGYGEPSVLGAGWASTTRQTSLGSNGLPLPLDSASVFDAVATQLTYLSGDFRQDQVVSIAIGDPSAIQIIFCFGFGRPDRTNQIETYSWNQPQELAGGSTLSVTYRTSWGRQ
jgi:hypothetical protein